MAETAIQDGLVLLSCSDSIGASTRAAQSARKAGLDHPSLPNFTFGVLTFQTVANYIY
jgi:hypothetical protein